MINTEKHARDYLRFELLFEPCNRVVGLHVDIQGAKNALFLRVDVRNELESGHID